MSETEINHLPWGFFDRLQNLKSLFLTGRGVLGTAMDLREIKPGAFDALRALERLDLARNWNLQPVHPRLLHKLTALRRLELAGTPAASDAYLAPGFFFALSNMEDLSFEATPIRELPILPLMPNVKYITYYSPQLRRVPRGYFDGYPDLYQTDENRVRFTIYNLGLLATCFVNFQNMRRPLPSPSPLQYNQPLPHDSTLVDLSSATYASFIQSHR